MNGEDFDDDGYPSDEALAELKTWPFADKAGWLERARSLWHWDNYMWKEGEKHVFATGGWSGNESVIYAMKENRGLWVTCWESSHRGGKYVFEVAA